MNRIALTLTRAFSIGLVSIVVLSAVFVGIGRQFVNHIHEAKPEIESYVSERIGLSISFDAIDGHWEKLTPAVSLKQLRIQSETSAASFLDVAAFEAEIDLGASLIHLRPIIKLWVSGLALDVEFVDGKFALANGPLQQASASKDQPSTQDRATLYDRIDFFLKQPHIQLSNSAINVKGFWQQDVTISDIDIGVARNGTHKRFWADLVLAGNSDITLQMKGEVQGSFGKADSLNGKMYAKIMAPNLAPWMPVPIRDLTALEVYEAEGVVELWGNINKGKVESVTSKLELSDVLLGKEGSDIKPPKLHRLATVGRWQGDWQHDWKLGLQSLEIDGEGFHWAPQEIMVHSDKTAVNARRFKGHLDNAAIAPWIRYYTSLLDPESKAYQTLNTIKPEAVLDNVLFNIDTVDRQITDYQIMADISEVTLQPKRWLPGINNVSAKVLIGKYLSVIDLAGENIQLNYPALFRDVLQIDHLGGALVLHNGDQEWRLETGPLVIDDSKVQAITQFAVIKDKQSEQSPYLRLQSNLSDINAKEHLPTLLPAGIIPDGIVKWIDGAVKQGNLLRGDILFHGPTNLHEFERLQYLVGLTFEDLTLSYLDDWRAVDGLTADILIENGRVDAWAMDGHYYGMDVKSVWVGTDKNEDDDLELTVDVDAVGRVENALQILVDSPIKDSTAFIMDTIAVTGNGQIEVDIVVPFRKEPDPNKPPLSLGVDVQLSDGEFTLIDNDLVVNQLNGDVSYDLAKGLSSSGLIGQVFGGQIDATIQTVPDDKDPTKQQTQVLTQGRAPLDQIKPWLKLDIVEPLEGEFPYSVDVFLKPDLDESAIKRSYLQVSSNLQGVAVDYPKPLYKEADTELPFSFKLSLGGEKQFQSIKVSDLFDLQMVRANGAMQRGAIAFSEDAKLPDDDVFTIAGTIDELDLDEWKHAVFSNANGETTEEEDTVSTIDRIEIDDSSLLVKSLSVAGQRFDQVGLTLSETDKHYQGTVDSPSVKGSVAIPKHYVTADDVRVIKEPIELDVTYLALDTDKKDTSVAPILENSETEKVELDPRILPALNLNIDQLTLYGEAFGAWQLKAIPINDGVRFSEVNFDLKASKFKGKGHWVWNEGNPKTFLKGKSTSKNVADVLEGWGYAKSLTSKHAQAILEGHWTGAPYEFNLNNVDAKWELLIKDGRFKDVSSGTADKVLGFLNFDDWLSRLQLKIKDLESNELPFSVIRGDFVLADQRLSTKELTIDSAAMKMTMGGALNLENQEIDAALDLAIPVTRNLVLPAAAVGGLPAAATVYVIEKVLGSQLDKLTTMEYTVKGPFKDPTVTLKDSFNILPKQIQESIVTNGANDKALSDEASTSTNVTTEEAASE